MPRTLGMIKDKKPLEIIWNNYMPKVGSWSSPYFVDTFEKVHNEPGGVYATTEEILEGVQA